jgi:hypothetical protein
MSVKEEIAARKAARAKKAELAVKYGKKLQGKKMKRK